LLVPNFQSRPRCKVGWMDPRSCGGECWQPNPMPSCRGPSGPVRTESCGAVPQAAPGANGSGPASETRTNGQETVRGQSVLPDDGSDRDECVREGRPEGR